MKIKFGLLTHVEKAFICYGLLEKKIDLGDYQFEPLTANLCELNDRASRGELEFSTVSIGAWPFIHDKYLIANCGASFGDGTGAKILARDAMSLDELKSTPIAIAGTTTSAYLSLLIYDTSLKTKLLPADKLIQAVETGLVDAALLLLEEHLLRSSANLNCLLDLGQWWKKRTGLLFPRSCMAIRRDLPAAVRSDLTQIMRNSIQYAMDNYEQALDYAMSYAGNMDKALAASLLKTYVNQSTLDMGQAGQKAISEFINTAVEVEAIPPCPPVEFA